MVHLLSHESMPRLFTQPEKYRMRPNTRLIRPYTRYNTGCARRLLGFFLVLTCQLAQPGRLAIAEPTVTHDKLDQVVINSLDVFDTGPGKLRRVRRLVNRLHWTTRNEVIQRQVWLRYGEPVSPGAIQELERNLRALDLFASVSIKTHPATRGDGWIDLIIDTRDKLSLIFSGSGSFLGGIGSVQFSAGETNLLGYGQRLVVGYSESTSGELRGSLGLDNVLLNGTDVYGGIKLGQTEEGDFAELSIIKRLQNLRDKHSWSVKLESEETKIDYYEQGNSIAEVPRNLQSLAVQRTWRRVSPRVAKGFWRFGPSLSWRELKYGQVSGSGASDVTVPDDTDRLFSGFISAYERTAMFEKVTWLDTQNFQQDLPIGFGTTVVAGAEYTDAGGTSDTAPLLLLNGWTIHKTGLHNYFSANLDSTLRLGNSSVSFWSLGVELAWYNTVFRQQTLAVSLKYNTAGEDDSELPVEQTLGENNGLRGYPAREFNGQQSVLLNLENRIRTPLSVASFTVGITVFMDAGWVNDRNQGLQDPHTSIGVGLRIGSRPILGRGVIRVDVAYPLDDDPVRDYQPTISLAVGQVFDIRAQ